MKFLKQLISDVFTKNPECKIVSETQKDTIT